MRLSLLTLAIALGLLACQEKSVGTTKTITEKLPLTDVASVLKMMQQQNATQLDSVANFYVQMNDGYQIYSIKDSTKKTQYIESRTTNQVVPGVERKLYRGNLYEIWNRGAFASLSAKDIQEISPLFTFLGTAVVDSASCYKLLVDKKKLFATTVGSKLFDDNNAEGNPLMTLYINPKHGLIQRIVGKNDSGAKVSVTWRKWTAFKSMKFPLLRSITESGGKTGITPEIEAQVSAMNTEMNEYLRQIDNGDFADVGADQLTKMRDGVTKTLKDNEQKMDQLRKGYTENTISISNIRLNKGYAPELF